MTRYKSYAEKLKDPRWQRKRLEIMERDEWQCRMCHSKSDTLAIHHLLYKRGVEPWDTDPEYLLALCEVCHSDVQLSQERWIRLFASLVQVNMPPETLCNVTREVLCGGHRAGELCEVSVQVRRLELLTTFLENSGWDILEPLSKAYTQYGTDEFVKGRKYAENVVDQKTSHRKKQDGAK